jgi:hypothetical protein
MVLSRGKLLKRHLASHQVRLARFAITVATTAALFFVAALSLSPKSASAIDLVGLTQPAAVDQPQINMLVRNVVNGVAGAPQVGSTLDIGFDNQGNPIIVTNTTVNITAYLDTGSSTMLISHDTADTWVDSNNQGIPNSTYNGQTVGFADIGVGGAANFNVSKPVVVQLASYTPTVNSAVASTTSTALYDPQQIPAQLVIGPNSDGTDTLQGFGTSDVEVVGMPALAGKVMVVDTKHLNDNIGVLGVLNGGDITQITQADLDNVALRTYIYNRNTPFHSGTTDTDPGIPSTNLHVKTSYADFGGFTTTTPSGAPGPTLAHNPMIGANPLAAPGTDKTPGIRLSFKAVDASHPGSLQTLATTGSFLFDTGAGASFISSNIAAQLHIRYKAGTKGTDNPILEMYTPDPLHPNDPNFGTSINTPLPQFQEAIGGIGPSTVAAGFYLDSLILPTTEANPNYLTDPRNLKFSGTRSANGQQNVLGPPVLVQDITATKNGQSITLDGDFGVNFLVGSIDLSGTGIDNLQIGASAPGAFDWFTFDEQTGVLGLKLNSAFHIAGDFNNDGQLTNADLQGMLNAMKNPSAYKSAHGLDDAGWLDVADVNRDGVVNTLDTRFLSNYLSGSKLYQAGDFNLDGKITSADLQAMLSALQNSTEFENSHDLTDFAWKELGDVNGDGVVNLADETALANLISGGGGGSLASVPEPAAWQLAAIAVALCGFALRRVSPKT